MTSCPGSNVAITGTVTDDAAQATGLLAVAFFVIHGAHLEPDALRKAIGADAKTEKKFDLKDAK